MTQDYFWTPEWQEAEKEADEDIKAGRVKRFHTAKEAIEWLKADNYNTYIKESEK